jgi:IclR family transcriptional regulator, blcABC operon repressor
MVETPPERDPAPAVTRSIRILGLLADAHGRAMPLSDIARAIGAAKSSTSNLCSVLEEHGLIQRRDGGYTLGRRTVELGGAYIASFDQVREFYRLCAESALLSHELVQIAVLDGTEVLYLARHEGRAPFRLAASIGDRFPAAPTAVGNALLSLLDPEEVAARFSTPEAFPRRTEKSTATLEQLQRKLAIVRKTGVAIDEGEVHPSVVGVAMVIPPRAGGEAPLAIGVSLVDPTPEHRAEVIDELRAVVGQLDNPLIVGG